MITEVMVFKVMSHFGRGTVTQKKQVNILGMYLALTALGHDQIWLRENDTGVHFLVTWEDQILARYEPSLATWRLFKNAGLADGFPHRKAPAGTGLTALSEEVAMALALDF